MRVVTRVWAATLSKPSSRKWRSWAHVRLLALRRCCACELNLARTPFAQAGTPERIHSERKLWLRPHRSALSTDRSHPSFTRTTARCASARPNALTPSCASAASSRLQRNCSLVRTPRSSATARMRVSHALAIAPTLSRAMYVCQPTSRSLSPPSLDGRPTSIGAEDAPTRTPSRRSERNTRDSIAPRMAAKSCKPYTSWGKGSLDVSIKSKRSRSRALIPACMAAISRSSRSRPFSREETGDMVRRCMLLGIR
mmetsp:Transcript_4594/g.10414  ORF Transcript_4594/g.10414 Transcript_4594/m.10414 type:complete len:254 (-) Transcript_4594:71-832(-)